MCEEKSLRCAHSGSPISVYYVTILLESCYSRTLKEGKALSAEDQTGGVSVTC